MEQDEHYSHIKSNILSPAFSKNNTTTFVNSNNECIPLYSGESGLLATLKKHSHD